MREAVFHQYSLRRSRGRGVSAATREVVHRDLPWPCPLVMKPAAQCRRPRARSRRRRCRRGRGSPRRLPVIGALPSLGCRCLQRGCLSDALSGCARSEGLARVCGAARGDGCGPRWPMASYFLHALTGFAARTRDGVCGPSEASAEAPRATAGGARDFRGQDARRRVRGLILDSAWAPALSRESCGRPREVSLCSDTTPASVKAAGLSASAVQRATRRPPKRRNSQVAYHSSRRTRGIETPGRRRPLAAENQL